MKLLRPTTFVAEFTTNHMGNLNVLLRMVERAKAAGADLIKMQKKDVKSFYSPEKLAAGYKSPYGTTYEDYRTIFEFEEEDYRRFDAKCRHLGIPWFVTIQDIPSLEKMLPFNLELYKVASCNARNRPLLEEIARMVPHDKRLIISVAGRTLIEIEETLNIFPHHRLCILHCVAEYPCPPFRLRLGNIPELRRQFGCERIQIGYSGHEEGLLPSLAAADLGAQMIERHFCLSRHTFVHHIECSLEPCEFSQMAEVIRHEPDLGSIYRPYLPPAAFATQFAMSDVEAEFLEKQTYGNTFLRPESKAQFHRIGK